MSAVRCCCHVVGQPKGTEGAAIPHAGGDYSAGYLAGRRSRDVPALDVANIYVGKDVFIMKNENKLLTRDYILRD